MEFKVGDKVRVNPFSNHVWGDGKVCEVASCNYSGTISIYHPTYGRGAVLPDELMLVPESAKPTVLQLVVGGKVLVEVNNCPASIDTCINHFKVKLTVEKE